MEREKRMIDWIATALEVTGVWLVGDHKSTGFLIKTCCSITWIITGIVYEVPGLIVAAGILLVVNARNCYKWKREEAASK